VASTAPPFSLLSGGGNVHLIDDESTTATSRSNGVVAGAGVAGAVAGDVAWAQRDACDWWRWCSMRQTSEGRAYGGSGGGRARVAAWVAMGLDSTPFPLPSRSSPAASACVDEETGGLGRQPSRL
jgi:hypothetical protein